ncbi:hypothetical protein F5Y10DRAFT_233343 [Nemania abortiva]|nr:hypothetical protein F5Y10DRAFT_233343 [Nemania abortiva]
MMFRCLFLIAHDNGVQPEEVSINSRLAPFSASSRAIFSCPLSIANHSGVQPSLVFASRLAPFSTSSRAIS